MDKKNEYQDEGLRGNEKIEEAIFSLQKEPSQEQLAHISLPLGGLRKTEVREIAEEHGFVNARKHDSQDICFVPDGDYAKFIEQYTGRKSIPGDFVDTEGKTGSRYSCR